jgi:hypothetical protein
VFDVSGTERLTEWRKIRDSLNSSNDPYQSVLEVWKRAPFVNQYLDPNNPGSWPDPWHLILDNRYDDLALALGIVYTLGLSERFIGQEIEIHMSMSDTQRESYFVIIKNTVIDIDCRIILTKDQLPADSKRIWSYQNKL